jgi:hypothetical protein
MTVLKASVTEKMALSYLTFICWVLIFNEDEQQGGCKIFLV